jgi:hypothetical protein
VQKIYLFPRSLLESILEAFLYRRHCHRLRLASRGKGGFWIACFFFLIFWDMSDTDPSRLILISTLPRPSSLESDPPLTIYTEQETSGFTAGRGKDGCRKRRAGGFSWGVYLPEMGFPLTYRWDGVLCFSLSLLCFSRLIVDLSLFLLSLSLTLSRARVVPPATWALELVFTLRCPPPPSAFLALLVSFSHIPLPLPLGKRSWKRLRMREESYLSKCWAVVLSLGCVPKM